MPTDAHGNMYVFSYTQQNTLKSSVKFFVLLSRGPVSYTHLDVYKRQVVSRCRPPIIIYVPEVLVQVSSDDSPSILPSFC